MFFTGVRFGLFHLHLPPWLRYGNSLYQRSTVWLRELTYRFYREFERRAAAAVDTYVYTTILIGALLVVIAAQLR